MNPRTAGWDTPTVATTASKEVTANKTRIVGAILSAEVEVDGSPTSGTRSGFVPRRAEDDAERMAGVANKHAARATSCV